MLRVLTSHSGHGQACDRSAEADDSQQSLAAADLMGNDRGLIRVPSRQPLLGCPPRPDLPSPSLASVTRLRMIRFAKPHKTKKLAQRRSRGAEIHVNDHEEGETKTGVSMDQGPQADSGNAQHVRRQAFRKEQRPARHCQYWKKQEHHHQIKEFLERVELALVAVRVRMWLSDEYAPQVVAGLPDQSRFDIAGHNLVVAAIPEDEISEQEQP